MRLALVGRSLRCRGVGDGGTVNWPGLSRANLMTGTGGADQRWRGRGGLLTRPRRLLKRAGERCSGERRYATR